MVPISGPGSLAETAAGVENPRANTLRLRIPTDPVRGFADRDTLGGRRKSANDEVLIVCPRHRQMFCIAFVALGRPLADGPFQSPQLLMVAGRNERRLAQAA